MIASTEKELIDFDQNVPTSLFPPLEAYYLFPQGEDLMMGKGKDGIRFIYDGATVYSEYQEKQLRELEIKLMMTKMLVPPYFMRSSLLRWLQGLNYKIDKCIKSMEEHFSWVLHNLPKQINSKIYDTLKSGVFYIHGRDHNFRPCLVWNAKVIKTINIDDMMEGLVYVLEYAKRNLFIPGHVENWLSIMDCTTLSLTSFPRKQLEPTMHTLQNNFRARGFHTFALNVSIGIRMIYTIASPFMESGVKKSFTIDGSMKCKKLIKLFNPCQLEERFGGTAPDVENFWPPIIMPEGPCITEETKLVSKEKHTEILKQDSRWVRPPVSRERYHDIYKPLDQRLADGQELVLSEQMERRLRAPPVESELQSVKKPSALKEESKEGSVGWSKHSQVKISQVSTGEESTEQDDDFGGCDELVAAKPGKG